jgi:hypothetical protein
MKDREEVAEELRRVREEVRERALHTPRGEVLPAPLAPRTPEAMPPDPAVPEAPPTPRPDNRGLNEGWRLTPALTGGGLRRRLARGLGRLLARVLETQESFNSRQVQFDNEVLAYIDARLDATHRQYDAVLGIHSRHMGEIDERHLILQEELVAHVHDLVKRIDLVLGEAERGRLGLEFALQDLRGRLLRLEERLRGGAPRA